MAQLARHGVDLPGEPAELVTIDGAGMLERRMKITIAAHVKATSYSTALNQILKEVETAIAGASLGGAKYGQLAEVGSREVSEGGDKPSVRQVFGFEFVYFTTAAAPDVAL